MPALVPRPLLPGALRRRYEPWRSDEARTVGWAIAACMAARTDVLRRLGPFDPDAFLFYEDMELCLRARDEGVPTMLRPDIRLRHLGGTSTERALGPGALELPRAAPARGHGPAGPRCAGARRRYGAAHARPPRGRAGAAPARPEAGTAPSSSPVACAARLACRGMTEPVVEPPPGNPRFPLFDSVRGIAVLMVVVVHGGYISGAAHGALVRGPDRPARVLPADLLPRVGLPALSPVRGRARARAVGAGHAQVSQGPSASHPACLLGRADAAHPLPRAAAALERPLVGLLRLLVGLRLELGVRRHPAGVEPLHRGDLLPGAAAVRRLCHAGGRHAP